jgi:hypothetical protein
LPKTGPAHRSFRFFHFLYGIFYCVLLFHPAIFAHWEGGTGDPPVPVGDPPTGMTANSALAESLRPSSIHCRRKSVFTWICPEIPGDTRMKRSMGFKLQLARWRIGPSFTHRKNVKSVNSVNLPYAISHLPSRSASCRHIGALAHHRQKNMPMHTIRSDAPAMPARVARKPLQRFNASTPPLVPAVGATQIRRSVARSRFDYAKEQSSRPKKYHKPKFCQTKF